MTTLPVLFVSHGAPTFAIEPGLAGPLLGKLGRQLSGIEAVLVLSPHWMTRGGVAVTASAQPETIHDFGGFPQALYELQYPVAGHPALAARTVELLRAAGWASGLDERRGLDHGAWVPLLHLLPEAHVPVFQVSLPYPLDTAGALRLGQALAPLRDEGVLIVASGSLTHNLYEFRQQGDEVGYVRDFTHWIRQALQADDSQALVEYRQRAPEAERAHPSEEHFLPLLVAQGARRADDALRVLDGGIEHGVLSMDAYLFGACDNLNLP
ncbi:dioxygenase [Pseudomonas sp. ABC1]|uniref:dioxygenase family protein n=1 Tax=Pseudomonas sp. ABC1 TaxID=2748080 RepID=UPI0015C33A78|nr:class III extradiol ring-cleavage dioxygenase [Pseudomonas sp. ABC1]QLF93705.1 dioxygenase [Pseudomonas sp. ABC1]